MIVGIGVDIVDVAEIADRIEEYGRSFLERTFTSREIEYCGGVPLAAQSYAARIAAKEAGMKALSTGWDAGVDWLDFEVVNQESGQPVLLAHGVAEQLLKERGVTNIWVTLAHVQEYAVAYVIFER